MLEVPGRQEINAVHGCDGDMRGVAWLRWGHGFASHQHFSKRLSLGGCFQQRNTLENRQSLGSGGGIATAAFVNNQPGNKQPLTRRGCGPPPTRDGLSSRNQRVRMDAPSDVADHCCFQIDALHCVSLTRITERHSLAGPAPTSFRITRSVPPGRSSAVLG